ncbi:hypothetical protein [Nitrolancea hollandica]|uniref:Uncharacterized protein n=1 Tax=Nitrolancea hollandica Lb TaxID=1129897 RepID=I4EL46_9BACT|nr:hypothetical protein [Nitrolancea hollandica]CCF85408.1 hypothetical protein NITHO_4920019 [Nitrolancea hollandica Lb]
MANPTRIRQALDVSSAPPSHNQIFVWDSATGQWTPKTLTPADIGAATASHTHPGTDITSTVADATNAQKLNGKTEADFLPASDHPHPEATTEAAGLMSAADKAKLDGIESSSGLSSTTLTSTSRLTLSTTYTEISGLAATLTKAGTYLILVTLDANFQEGDNSLRARVVIAGVNKEVWTLNPKIPTAGAVSREPMSFHATVTAAVNDIVKVEAMKATGSGGSYIETGSAMTAIWLHS